MFAFNISRYTDTYIYYAVIIHKLIFKMLMMILNMILPLIVYCLSH